MVTGVSVTVIATLVVRDAESLTTIVVVPEPWGVTANVFGRVPAATVATAAFCVFALNAPV